MADDRYPHDMMTDILVLMPKGIGERVKAWMGEKDKDVQKGNLAVMDISVEMKKELLR
jgi:hypothetical protein